MKIRRTLKKSGKKKITFSEPLSDDWEYKPLFSSVKDNKSALEQLFDKCSDVVMRSIYITNEKIPAVLVFIKEIVDQERISKFIINPLTEMSSSSQKENATSMLIEKLINENIISSEVNTIKTFGKAVNSILEGNTLLIIDNHEEAINISTRGRIYRSIGEPTTETVLAGSKEAFTESLAANTVLIRERIKTAKLKVEQHSVGRVSKTNINIIYLEGIASTKIIESIKNKIQSIDIDAILSTEYIKELILDNQKTIFPLIDRTERPDKMAAEILEGRIGIVVEGTPFVIIAPAILVQFIQSAEDYFQNHYFSSAVRILRYILLFFSLFLPGAYLAVITFHQELLPTTLAYSIAAAREGVPFPAFLELLMMAIMFEAFREAGVRLPKQVGQAVSIVGALIIGDAAVSAKIVSPATVIVIAFTGISSFAIPSQDFSLSIRILVFPIIILGGILGFYGVILGSVVILMHLSSLHSFGVPYLSSVAPYSSRNMKDTFIRKSWKRMKERPRYLDILNNKRED